MHLFGGGAGAGNNGSGGSSKKRTSRPSPATAAAAAAAAALAAVAAVAARRSSRARGPRLPTAQMHGSSQEGAAAAGGAPAAVAERVPAAAHGSGKKAAAAAPALRPSIDPRFEGTWIKLKDKSSSMEEALDACRMSGLPRRAAGLVRGVAVYLHPRAAKKDEGDDKKGDDEEDDAPPAVAETEFEFAVFSALPLIKIRERYTIDGPPGKARRRDLRRGQHTARAVSLEGGNAMRLVIDWPDPFGGEGYDEFRINELDELVISSELTLNTGERVAFHAVHRRK